MLWWVGECLAVHETWMVWNQCMFKLMRIFTWLLVFLYNMLYGDIRCMGNWTFSFLNIIAVIARSLKSPIPSWCGTPSDAMSASCIIHRASWSELDQRIQNLYLLTVPALGPVKQHLFTLHLFSSVKSMHVDRSRNEKNHGFSTK